jgi:DNA-binding CsgD family transcriptional regulator
MMAIELVEEAERVDDFSKICERLDKVAQKLSGFSVEIAKQQAVIVKGFLVLSSLPSKALLDKTLPEEFKNTRIGTKFVKIVSGYFYNKLGSLSRKFYKSILEKHAVWAGFGYIVPAHRVQQFISDIEELRKEYEEFERQLIEFLEEGKIPEDISDRAKIDPEYVELVREYLREYGIDEIKAPNIVDRVKIRLIPFSVDMQIVQEYLEEDAIKIVQREIEAVKQEMFENIKKQLEETIDKIYEEIKNYEEKIKNYKRKRMSKKVLKKLKEDIKTVIQTAEDLGVNIHRVYALKNTLKTIEALENAKVMVPEEIDGRLKALLKK